MLKDCKKLNDFHIIIGISENPNPTQVPRFFEIKTKKPSFLKPDIRFENTMTNNPTFVKEVGTYKSNVTSLLPSVEERNER